MHLAHVCWPSGVHIDGVPTSQTIGVSWTTESHPHSSVWATTSAINSAHTTAMLDAIILNAVLPNVVSTVSKEANDQKSLRV
jgi:hypothetical protein